MKFTALQYYLCLIILKQWICFWNWKKVQKQPSRGVLGKGVPKICSKFTGEHPYPSAISKKLQSKFIEITLRHEFAPVYLLRIFRTLSKNTLGWLLLEVVDKEFLILHQIKTTGFRSSRPEVFLEKCVLKICSKFIGGYPCRILISIKLQSNFIEITLRREYAPVNLLHIFRTLFSKNAFGWLLLGILQHQHVKTLYLFYFILKYLLELIKGRWQVHEKKYITWRYFKFWLMFKHFPKAVGQ